MDSWLATAESGRGTLLGISEGMPHWRLTGDDIPAEIGPMITDERLRRVWTILIGLTAMAITVGLATIVVHDRIH